MRISYLPTYLALLIFGATLLATPADAQYFGRNKVQYDDFDFNVLRTDHFDIYFYEEERVATQDAARMAERWYRRHSRTFLRDFKERKPIIFYANDADFQQTNVISGSIGQGTGGVTEALKERVVMPFTGLYAENDHVLGHELVHSFQYDIALNSGDSTGFNIGRLPLWLVEGMAEYLSVGREDAHTAMWLRDAALRDDLPTISQMTRDMRYFPYRFGQAYMAYIGGKYGDASVTNLYKLAGRTGVDSAIVYTLGIKPDSLSKEWITAVKDLYLPQMEDRTPAAEVGRRILSEEGEGGTINISPVVSPDGRYVAFLSERDVFNINLFIADAETGRVVKRLGATLNNPHFDALRFINSAGSWSPDSRRFVFVTFVEGDNELAVWNINRNKIERRIRIRGVSALANPSWSPDGRYVAFTGLSGGISDLYVFDTETNEVRQLTDDRYADLQPAWSPDGSTIAFTTDRGPVGTNFETLSYAEGRIGLVDVASGEIEVLRPFGAARHHNPQFAPDGNSLYFISNQDGFTDIYRYALDEEQAYRVTRVTTGVSGITELSPALSVASESGRLMFSVFSDGEYAIHTMTADEAQGTPVEAQPGVATAGVLPPMRPVTAGLVGSYLNDPEVGLPPVDPDYPIRDYNAKLSLAYVAPPSVGASVGGPYGSGFAGGVGFFFTDMLGNQNLTLVAQANGTLKDIGGQVSYMNMGNRINYGGSAAHIPIRYGGYGQPIYNESGQFVGQQRLIRRIFYDYVSGDAYYPLTTTRRFESSLGFVRLAYDYEVETYDYTGGGINRSGVSACSDLEPAERASRICEPDPVYFFTGNFSYVGDFSNFGFTSPLQGGRYRFGVSPYVGTEQFVRTTADYRRYFFLNPLTFAARGLHIGNYGAASPDDQGQALFTQVYLGDPYYQGFIRGYSFNSFSTAECEETPEGGVDCSETEDLFGSLQGTRIAMGSVELRLPLLGTEQLGLINFPYLPTELTLFVDGGVAWWGRDESLSFGDIGDGTFGIDASPVFSAGTSARINLLGALVFEIYYAYPFQRTNYEGDFLGGDIGLLLQPGW